MALDAFLDYLSLERRLSPNTVSAYRADLELLETQAGPLPDLDSDRLRAWLGGAVRDGYAPATIKRRVATLRTFYRWAHRRGVVPCDPSLLLVSPKVPKRLPRTLKAGQVRAMLDAAQGVLERAILELLYGAGLRVSELCGLVVVADLDVRIVTQEDGELLRRLTLDPTRDYQPQG